MGFLCEVKVKDDEEMPQLEDVQQDGISDDLEPEENKVEQMIRKFL